MNHGLESKSKLNSQSETLPDLFFDYWDNLQNFLEMDNEMIKLLKQDIRSAIIDILALGIEDIDPRTDQPRKRHAMTAKELQEAINQKLTEPVKKSNLYFHLDKLEEMGLIKEIGQIRIGKQHITYYGRTAKAFTYPDEGIPEKFAGLLTSGEFANLIKRINPNIPEHEITNTLDEAFDNYFRKCRDDILSEWLDKYQEDVLELEIDIRRFFDIFDIFAKYDSDTIDSMRKIAELLDFKKFYQ